MRPGIVTYSGAWLDLLHPETSAFTVMDIAHGLANTCRFAGQCSQHYSVAQHSVLVSQVVRPELALAALFHDAAEAFVGDVPTPLKELLPEYRRIEKRIERVIFERLGLPLGASPEIKHADLVLLATEMRDLMPRHAQGWVPAVGIRPLEQRIVALAPVAARGLFLDRVIALAGAELISGWREPVAAEGAA